MFIVVKVKFYVCSPYILLKHPKYLLVVKMIDNTVIEVGMTV